MLLNHKVTAEHLIRVDIGKQGDHVDMQLLAIIHFFFRKAKADFN